MKEGLELARTCNIGKLEVETDAESLIFMIDTSGANPNPYHELIVVIEDVKKLIQEDGVVEFKHIPR